MFQKSYLDYIREDPESEFSKFLIKFFDTKPDLEKNGTGVREFNHQFAMEQKEEILSKTPKPIPFSEIKGTMDYRGLLAYAKSQGKKISELTQLEKKKFYTE